MTTIIKYSIAILLILSSFTSSKGQVSENMSLLGQWHNPQIPAFQGITYNEIWGWENPIDDRVYAIVGTSESTLFIDITDPAIPVIRDAVLGEHTKCIHRDYKTYSHYAYGVADEGRTSTLQVFDLSFLPDSVSLVYNSDEFFIRSHNIFIDEPAGRLYAVGCDSEKKGVITLDLLESPESPQLISSIDLGEYSHDVYVKNDTVYLSNGPQGLVIWDYTDANNPIQLGNLRTYPEQGYNHSSWLSEDGTKLVMADETHGKSMKVIDVTNFETMTVSSLFKSELLAPEETNSIPHNPFIAGDYAIISYYHDGVQIYDISDPENPTRAGYYDTYSDHDNYQGYRGCWGVYPFLKSGIIIAADISNGLYVLHTDFAFPYEVSAEISKTDVSCNQAENGSISVTGTGGGNKYTYSWDNRSTEDTLTDLPAGNYSFTVTDQWGHSYTDSIEITQPEDITITDFISKSLCPESEDGQISVETKGGTPPYNYIWTNGATDSVANNLASGIHILQIGDSNGCEKAYTFTLSSENEYAEAGFNYIIKQEDDQCQIIFENTSTNYTSLNWDLDDFGFSGVDVDTLLVSNGTYTFCLEVTNDCGSEMHCEEVEIICSTSNTEIEEANWEIYPNPVMDFINISSTKYLNPSSISIHNSLGIELHSSIITKNLQLDISSWTTGNYNIRIRSNGSIETYNFTKL